MNFLKHFSGSVFQIFKDKSEAKGYPQVLLEYNEEQFKTFNKLGCGVYFTPNFFKGGRKEENLTYINAVFADLDVAKEGEVFLKDEIQAKKDHIKQELAYYCDTPPSFVIDTKNGLQPIWLVRDGEVTEESKKKFKSIIQGIIQLTVRWGSKGDQVKDFSRVLRLPNFYHMKSDPYLCTVEQWDDVRYDLGHLVQNFPFVEEKKNVVVKKESTVQKYFGNGGPVETGVIIETINNIPIRELAPRAFAYVGRIASFDNQDRLILDGRLTGNFIGKTGGNFMASTSHEDFSGSPVTCVAKILRVTNSESYEWIRDQYGLDEKKLKVKKMIEELKPVVQKKTVYFDWGTPQLTKNFAPIKPGTYCIIGAGYGVGKTTFCMNMALRNVAKGHKVLYLSLEMSTEELFDYLSRKAAGITIEEEIEFDIPSEKQERYNQRKKELESLENFVLKGVVGGTNIDFETLEELMKGEWDMIFVDNFNLIQKDVRTQQLDHEGQLSSRLLAYASQKQVALIVVHHYSKGGARANNKDGYSLSGNTKIVNDAHRIVLLERKRFDEDETPTEEDRASMTVVLDKGRGYDSGIKKYIYFVGGVFLDKFPVPARLPDNLFEY